MPPGGAADFIARLVGGKLAESLGQPVLVENRGGAGGTIAADAVAKAAPDGYTLLQNSITTHGVGPHLYAKLPYDPVKDFAPVSGLALLPLIMAVNAELACQEVSRSSSRIRRASSLNFASSGNGGAPHMAAELFKSVTGAPITHVPYKGSGPAVADLVGGRVQIMFDAAPSLIAHMRSGRLRVLGRGERRSATGCCPRCRPSPSSATRRSRCRCGTGCSRPPVRRARSVEKLNREAARALTRPTCASKLLAQGAEPMPGTPEAFASFMQEEMAKWAPVVKQAGRQAGLTAELAARSWRASRWEDVPAAIRREGERGRPQHCRLRAGRARATRRSSILRRTFPHDDALLDAAAATAHDYDDTHLRTVIHATPPVAGALFSPGQDEKRQRRGSSCTRSFSAWRRPAAWATR